MEIGPNLKEALEAFAAAFAFAVMMWAVVWLYTK